MQVISRLLKKLSLYTTAFVLSGLCMVMGSAAAFAEDAPCVAPPDSSYGAGVHHPTGTEAVAFTYDCATDTWNSAYYTYYPGSNTRTAKYAPNYGFDCATGIWYMDQYNFNTVSGTYSYARVATGDPGLPTGCPVAAPTPVTTGGSGDIGTTDTPTPISGISNTGSGSTNGTSNDTTLNNTATNTTTTGMSNILVSTAASGNAIIVGNTTGGSAGTGDAQSIANIANLLQSTSNAFGPGVATFTANINGDVTGDFMFDPSALLNNTGVASTNTSAANLTVNTDTSNTVNAQIANTIDVGATSGNATVAGNTSAGDATSGNAEAVVNLMNLINSTVASGQSFVGTININGNLNGDILLPQGLIDQLLAATGPNSVNTASANLTDNSTTTNTVNQNIANVIQSSATTGNANVTGNTTGGTATTGNASTGVTLLNLTGSNTFGKNNILVFVNVLGQWVGMIMNAPTGTTAASLGGDITQTGPNSVNTASANLTDNSTTTNTLTHGITNNVNVHAASGDATVANNTTGGNATSGNASTAVNILNLSGVNISLSDWFGVLFINVFGIWNGSFGINTAAGNPAANPTNNPVQAANQEAMLQSFKQFASFAPSAGGGSASGNTSTHTHSSVAAIEASAVLGNTTSVAQKAAATVAAPTLSNDGTFSLNSLFLPALGLLAAGSLLFVSERGRFTKKN